MRFYLILVLMVVSGVVIFLSNTIWSTPRGNGVGVCLSIIFSQLNPKFPWWEIRAENFSFWIVDFHVIVKDLNIGILVNLIRMATRGVGISFSRIWIVMSHSLYQTWCDYPAESRRHLLSKTFPSQWEKFTLLWILVTSYQFSLPLCCYFKHFQIVQS